MIFLSEQYGYKDPKPIEGIEPYFAALNKKEYKKAIQRGENKSCCFNITHHEGEINPYRFETSYFVGVDWVVENELPIYVEPKLNDNNTEVNYIQMLFDIMREPDNYNHLDELCEIYFDKPTISIKQQQDLLTPLLLIQYVNIIDKIVRKGLKKSYYTVTKNLNAKVKGRILINETIKKNLFNNKVLFNYCTYSEFGINNLENKVLKKAFTFSVSALQNLHGVNMADLNHLINYIRPAFQYIDEDVDINDLKAVHNNNFYSEYSIAIKYAKLIFKRFGYNISSTSMSHVNTPPFWIDMSKLFELYVFSKLKERFNNHNEVIYHKKFNYLEPDFIVNTSDGVFKMVVEAKYKPRYKDGNVSTEDIRQISGYARLKKVYEYLNVPEDRSIDCLVVYSDQKSNRKSFVEDFRLEVEKNYSRFFKIGIELPYQ